MNPRSPAAILPDIGLSRAGRVLRDTLEARGYRLARGKRMGEWEVWKIRSGDRRTRIKFPPLQTLDAVRNFIEGREPRR